MSKHEERHAFSMPSVLARCPYCQLESEPAYQHGEPRMTICASCGAWFVWPAPAAAEVLEHYSANVQGMPAGLREWRIGTSQAHWYGLLAKKIARKANHRATRIADVGAGALELTTSLAAEFPNA